VRRWHQEPERFYRVAAPLARLTVWLLTDLTVTGVERVPARGGVLLAANHVSFLDPVVLAEMLYRCGHRKVRFLALRELFERPLLGWALRRTGTIPVVRGQGAERMVEDACAALDAGEAVLLYPEGTIVPFGQVRPGQRGAGLLALRAGVQVLPVATSGLERGRGRRLNWLRRPATVTVGPAVDLARWRGRLDPQAEREASAALLAACGISPNCWNRCG
jgi:1-acyl-sn-glycerol-3-phosphate acyltransferase